MGLDMYLIKKRKSTGEIIDEECVYWRKANQIRKWFVDHTGYPEDGDCIEHLLTKEDLKSLVSDCKRVLLDHDLAEKILPTSSGFFFGSTDYNDFYYYELKNTATYIEDLLKNTDFETEDIYYLEWW